MSMVDLDQMAGRAGRLDCVCPPEETGARASEGPAVWVVVDNKVHRQPVKVRQFREDGVLLSAGLQGNETVVAVGANRLAEGQAVKPMPQEPAR